MYEEGVFFTTIILCTTNLQKNQDHAGLRRVIDGLFGFAVEHMLTHERVIFF